MRPSPARGCGFRGGRGRRDAPAPGRLRAFAGGRSGKAAESDGGDTPGDRAVHVLWKRRLHGGGLAWRAKGRTRQRASSDYNH